MLDHLAPWAMVLIGMAIGAAIFAAGTFAALHHQGSLPCV
jgi:hypothetical protein